MKMTPNRRIALNIAATYARSIYTLALGLVTARWLLLSLGQTDYGLFGVVGGLVSFVTVINSILANAVGRFYAVAIGKGQRDKSGASQHECRRWFTAALTIHTVIPLLLMSVGWPLGEYTVDHFLVIPADRLVACHWVWRMACCTAFVSMINVPFRAMYTAKQEIAELTVYSVLSATLNAVLLYYMVSHPGDWLSSYAAWHCLLTVFPMLAVGIRGAIVYPECRIEKKFLLNWGDLRKIFFYAGWNAFDMAGTVVKAKGTQVLVNRAFGPTQNAAMTVASHLAAKANVFSSSLVGAFIPAIATAYGAGKIERMRGLVFRVGKLSGLLVTLFSLPLCLEVSGIMTVWLKDPPTDSPFLCVCVLVTFFLDKISIGHRSAIAASGRIAVAKVTNGINKAMTIPVTWGLFAAGFGLRAVGLVMIGSTSLLVLTRIVEARRVAGVSVGRWLGRVFAPMAATICLGMVGGMLARIQMQDSLLRIALVCVCSEIVMLPMAWFVVLDVDERKYVKEKGKKVLRKFLDLKRMGANASGPFKLAPGFTRVTMSRFLDAFSESARVTPPVREEGAKGNLCPGERCVWQLWLQGEDSAPRIVKHCIESVRRFTAPRRHILLDAKTISDYIDVPGHIVSLYKSGKMGAAVFSDYVRVMLLERYGGVWIDATVWLSGPVQTEMLDADFFVFSSPLWRDINAARLSRELLGPLRFFSDKPSATLFGSNWWIAASPNSPVLRIVRKLLDEYWSRVDAGRDYLIFYDLLSLAVLENAECRAIWGKMPKCAPTTSQLLRSLLKEKYDAAVMDAVLRLTPVHKLVHADNLMREGTFFGHLLSGSCHE